MLAAGGGRRFGGAKLAAGLDGWSVLDRALAAMLAVPAIERIVVVLGAHADEVRAAADLGAVETVVCEDWDEGIAASLRAGLEPLADAAAVVVTLGDQPFITPQVIAAILDRAEGPAFVRSRVERVLLVGEEGPRHRPTFTLAAQEVTVGHDRAVEVDEIEFGAAVHLPDRVRLDAGLLRRAEEERQSSVLGHFPVRAGQHHAVRDDQRAARPDLRAGDPPLVAVADGRRAGGGEVRSGVRFGEHLARRLAAVGHAPEEAVALLVVAVTEQHRREERRADPRRRP